MDERTERQRLLRERLARLRAEREELGIGAKGNFGFRARRASTAGVAGTRSGPEELGLGTRRRLRGETRSNTASSLGPGPPAKDEIASRDENSRQGDNDVPSARRGTEDLSLRTRRRLRGETRNGTAASLGPGPPARAKVIPRDENSPHENNVAGRRSMTKGAAGGANGPERCREIGASFREIARSLTGKKAHGRKEPKETKEPKDLAGKSTTRSVGSISTSSGGCGDPGTRLPSGGRHAKRGTSLGRRRTTTCLAPQLETSRRAARSSRALGKDLATEIRRGLELQLDSDLRTLEGARLSKGRLEARLRLAERDLGALEVCVARSTQAASAGTSPASTRSCSGDGDSGADAPRGDDVRERYRRETQRRLQRIEARGTARDSRLRAAAAERARSMAQTAARLAQVWIADRNRLWEGELVRRSMLWHEEAEEQVQLVRGTMQSTLERCQAAIRQLRGQLQQEDVENSTLRAALATSQQDGPLVISDIHTRDAAAALETPIPPALRIDDDVTEQLPGVHHQQDPPLL